MAITTAAFDDGSDGASKATYTPGRNPNIGVGYGTDYAGIVENQAVGGEVYTIERFGKRRSWSMNYTFLNSTDQAKLQALIDYADGKRLFFILVKITLARLASKLGLIKILSVLRKWHKEQQALR